jgi:hypothetical protein
VTPRDLGPPEDDAARTASPSHPGTSVKGLAKTHTRHPECNAALRHIGRYAAGWKAGFTAGAIDALRRAGRWLPPDPDSWAVPEDLADAYRLAGDDVAGGYTLVAGDD